MDWNRTNSVQGLRPIRSQLVRYELVRLCVGELLVRLVNNEVNEKASSHVEQSMTTILRCRQERVCRAASH